MKEAWVELEEFPEYAINNYGAIANIKTGMPRRISINQQGHPKITLYRDGRLYTRAVATLVADAFLDVPTPYFDTPIHLDGDLQNCRADNLMWRPRWFAILYHRQFRKEEFYLWNLEIVDITNDVSYSSVMEACVVNGLYFQDVIKSFTEHIWVPLTFQEFRRVD